MRPRREDGSALAGRVVAITGAASGIGRALALACARRGATLALADVWVEELTTLEVELEALGMPRQHYETRRVDVSAREQVESWAADVASRFGAAAVVVNCAGVSLHCPLDETSADDFQWVMATNFWGVVHGSQAFLPQLASIERGHLINVSSVFGLGAFPRAGAYAASKFAVRGFTEGLAIELSLTHPSIFVTCVHPGGIKTPLVRRGRVRGSGRLASTPEDAAASFEREMARMSAADCAEHIARVMVRPRSRLLIGTDARLIDWGVRLFPSFYKHALSWLIRRGIRRDPSERISL
jgi:NAD(P)-dependent dehydrogenase (short-subunit alcohol dehydrogenase family)